MQHIPERQSCARVCEQTFSGVLLTRRTAAVVSVPTGASTPESWASCTRTLGVVHAKGSHPPPAPEPGGAPPATALCPLARAPPLAQRSSPYLKTSVTTTCGRRSKETGGLKDQLMRRPRVLTELKSCLNHSGNCLLDPFCTPSVPVRIFARNQKDTVPLSRRQSSGLLFFFSFRQARKKIVRRIGRGARETCWNCCIFFCLASAPAFYSRWPYWLRVNELEHARGARIKTGNTGSMAAWSEKTRGELKQHGRQTILTR